MSFARQFGSSDELREAINAEIAAGADLIKIALDTWNEGMRPEGTPAVPFDADLLAVAVSTAHAAGLTIACHANDPESCRLAARSGVDSLEHGMMLEAEDLDAMAHNGTVLVPTLSVWDAWLFYCREVGWSEARKARAEALRESSRAAVAGAARAGVPVALGTDAGGGSVRHGRVAREVELMIECGLTPDAALRAGTSVAARLLGSSDRVPSRPDRSPTWCCWTPIPWTTLLPSGWWRRCSRPDAGWPELPSLPIFTIL